VTCAGCGAPVEACTCGVQTPETPWWQIEAQCQYCGEPRVARGSFGSSPVSLCETHAYAFEGDFDRIERRPQ